jgi:hypothetical protein
MKRLITALVLCTVTSGMSAAQSQNKYEDLANELEIMSGVLNTSLRQNVTSDSWRVNQIDTSYLAGQGAVFTLSLRGHSNNWVHEIETLVEGFVGAVPSAPPVPPVPHISGSFEEMDEIVMEATREWESYAEATSRHFSHALADNNDRMREKQNASFATLRLNCAMPMKSVKKNYLNRKKLHSKSFRKCKPKRKTCKKS